MDNPFIQLLNKVESHIREQVQIGKPEDLWIIMSTNIRLLKYIYRSMHEYDMRENIHTTSQDKHEDYMYEATKAILDYFQFINILNQFGRILKNKYSITIPKFNRINFYRNKVSEHWEDYTNYGITGSHFQTFGEAAIPYTNHVVNPVERVDIKDSIDAILKDYNLAFNFAKPEVSNTTDLNAEEFYSILEKIDPTLATTKNRKYIIPNKLVELLFKFGFPAPIRNVKEYSNDLVGFLEKELGL